MDQKIYYQTYDKASSILKFSEAFKFFVDALAEFFLRYAVRANWQIYIWYDDSIMLTLTRKDKTFDMRIPLDPHFADYTSRLRECADTLIKMDMDNGMD